jgi:hypothetical protein
MTAAPVPHLGIGQELAAHRVRFFLFASGGSPPLANAR